MQFQPYLTFGGNCAEAMTHYEKVLGARMQRFIRFSDAPPMPEGAATEGCPGGELTPDMMDKVMHATIELDGAMLMASDSLAPYEGMKNVAVTLSFPSIERAEQVFTALASGGTVVMPFSETFWVEKFGAVTDKFGTSWLINGGKAKLN